MLPKSLKRKKTKAVYDSWDKYSLAVSKGYLDSVPADKVAEFESSLFDYLEANNANDLKTIIKEGVISDKLETSLEKAISAFANGFTV